MGGKRHDHAGLKARQARRATATARPELLVPTTPRVPPASPTSMPIKQDDPETRRMIDEALARRGRR